jgi:2-polyprenyl-3-methyl-5-hydroxy-6-metoxy-1,4-benzoquinol methylase
MRSALEINPETEQERFVHRFDMREIDAPNPNSFWRLLYVWRLRQMVAVVKGLAPPGSRILEIGCAQGNLSITLAESGYRVTAVDSQPGFISYARKKDDRQAVRWVVGDAFELRESERFSVVVMAEIIEHVTLPVDLIRRAFDLLEPQGTLVLTTPSWHCLNNTLPTFEEARRATGGFAGVRIGPAGEDHIFAFKSAELRGAIRDAGGRIVRQQYAGSVLLNSHVQSLLDVPGAGAIYLAGVRASARLPLVNRLLGPTLVVAVRKES